MRWQNVTWAVLGLASVGIVTALLRSTGWRGTLDVLSTTGTVVAAVLAVLAIRNGNRQAQDAAARLVRERRFDFELGLLGELTDALHKAPHVAFSNIPIDNALRMLPESELPNIRAYVGKPATQAAKVTFQRAMADQTPVNGVMDVVIDGKVTYRQLLLDEVDQAVRDRLTAR